MSGAGIRPDLAMRRGGAAAWTGPRATVAKDSEPEKRSGRGACWRARAGARGAGGPHRSQGLKIAQVSPLYESVPPSLYGGTERVVSYLTEELVRQGHEVTLFASGDSQT